MNSSSVFRFVTPKIQFMTEYERDGYGTDDGNCKFKGVIGKYTQIFADEGRKLISDFRCTIDYIADFGAFDENTGNYSGILGALQSGSATMSTMPAYYPVEDSEDIFDYTRPLVEDTMTIMSFYNKSQIDTTVVRDIFFMFDAVPIPLWIAVFLCYLTFVLVLRLGQRLIRRRNKPNAIWITSVAFLGQDNFPNDRKFLSVLSISVCTGMFFANSFMKNLISTDLVVVPPPLIIKDYDDIISRSDIKVMTSKTYPETQKFLESPKYTKRRKMYDEKRLKEVIPGIIDDDIIRMHLTQKLVSVGRPVAVEADGYIALAVMGNKYPRARALLSIDPDDAQKFTNVFVIRKNIPTLFSWLIKRTQTILFESGIMEHGNNMGAVGMMEEIANLMPMFEMKPSMLRMMSVKVEEFETDFIPVALKNIIIFLKFHLYLLAVASFVLIFEKIRKSLEKPRQKKPGPFPSYYPYKGHRKGVLIMRASNRKPIQLYPYRPTH